MCVACRLEKTINPYAPTVHETGFGIAANIGTAASIALDSPVVEDIDFTGDQDWFRVTLQAGATYAVALTGLTLSDPFLSVHNGGGTQIAFDDDGGVGLNAFLTFTSTFGGTHYLSAGAFGTETGSYELLITRTDAGPVARDDYTATTATTGVVGLGLDATGTIEAGGDTDWFALDLVAGQPVLISLSGLTLEDPALTLLDAQGAVLAFNDDAGGLDSALAYTADSDQTVYVQAAGYDAGQTGSYRITVDPYVTQPYDPLATIDWGTQLSDPVVSYYFAPPGVAADGYTSEGFNAYEQSRIAAAFEQIAQVSALRFVQTDSRAAADFVLVLDANESRGEFLGYFNPPGEFNAGVGVFDATQWDRTAGGDLEPGGFGMVTITHEVLHGLGLAHPHDTGGTSAIMGGVFGEYEQYGDHDLNQGVFTTMTYNNGYFTGDAAAQGATSGRWGFETGPMALDIAVLQAKYGANDWFGGDDDVYELPDANRTGTAWRAIWDTDGVDTLRHAGTRDAVIDLRPATLAGDFGGGGFLSAASGVAGGYTIAAGVVIENALGGAGDDLLIGNEADNILTGGAGNDTLRGGAGTDTAVLDITRAQLGAIAAIEGGVELHSAQGRDRLFGIEYVKFRDVTWTTTALLAGPDPDAPGGPGQVVTGTAASETLLGGGGDDTINAAAGSDRVEAGAGWDSVAGGVGADTLLGGAGNDTLQGANGFDLLQGGSGDDLLEGNFGNDTLEGGDGNDELQGGLGFDSMAGGRGDDLLVGRDGFDTLRGDEGADTLEGNNGNDSLEGGTGDDRLTGGLGADTLHGGAGSDFLFGSTGFDVLFGGAGADRLEGNAGNDTLDGGAGEDVLKGGIGADTFVFGLGYGADRVADFQNGIDAIRIDADLLAGVNPVASDLIAYAGRTADGFLILDFGGGDTLTFTGVTNTGAILDEVSFI